MNRFIFFFSFFPLLFISCTREDINPNDYSETEEKTGTIIDELSYEYTEKLIVDQSLFRYIQKYEEDILILDRSAKNIDKIEEGSILMSGPTDKAPNGFLLKVLSLSDTPEGILLEVAPAKLQEAFKNLSLKARHRNDGSLKIRDESVELLYSNQLPIPFTTGGIGANYMIDFGYEGDILYELHIEDGRAINAKIGVDKFRLRNDFTFSSFFYAVTEIQSKSFHVRMPFTIVIPDPPITINFKAEFAPTVELNSRFGLECTIKTTFPEVSFLGEFDPVKYPEAPYVGTTQDFGLIGLSEIDQEFILSDVIGSVEVETSVPVKIIAAPNNAFEVLGLFVEFKTPGIKVSGEPQATNDGFEFVSEVNLTGAITVGIESEALNNLFSKETVDKSSLSLNLWEDEFQLGQFRYPFDCFVTFGTHHFEQQCLEDEDKVSYNFRVDSDNGSTEGYKIYLNGKKLPGSYAYNQEHIRTVSSMRVGNVAYITIQDNENIGCRIEYILVNPCTSGRVCESQPLVDERDMQNYCFLTMGDGRQWLSSNINYDGVLSHCHEESDANCYLIGRYYTWSSAQSACPEGWRLPTVEEWNSLADSEANVTSFFVPELPFFGNVEAEQTNGFNIIPSGQYFGYYESLSYPYSGSIYDFGSTRKAIFWTSDEYVTDEGDIADRQFAYAFELDETGITRVVVPQDMGLPCRCIRE